MDDAEPLAEHPLFDVNAAGRHKRELVAGRVDHAEPRVVQARVDAENAGKGAHVAVNGKVRWAAPQAQGNELMIAIVAKAVLHHEPRKALDVGRRCRL